MLDIAAQVKPIPKYQESFANFAFHLIAILDAKLVKCGAVARELGGEAFQRRMNLSKMESNHCQVPISRNAEMTK